MSDDRLFDPDDRPPHQRSYPLYDGVHPHERASDTSFEAAVAMPESKAQVVREQVFRFVRDQGGATSDEVEAALDLRHQTASARLRELVLMERLCDSGARRRTRSGRRATVWTLTG